MPSGMESAGFGFNASPIRLFEKQDVPNRGIAARGDYVGHADLSPACIEPFVFPGAIG